MPAKPRLILFARYPVPGECKTRLIPAVGPAGAAAIHRKLAQHCAQLLCDSGCPVTIAYTGAGEDAFAEWLGERPDFAEQASGDLTARLLPFCDDAPLIFFGSDTPDLGASHIAAAIAGLETHEVVIGPALDGGYYLIGISKPLPQLFTDMPWSSDQVLPETLRRLRAMEIEPLLLEPLSDCDTPADLEQWPELTERLSQ